MTHTLLKGTRCEIERDLAAIDAELKRLKTENTKLREELSLAHHYAQNDLRGLYVAEHAARVSALISAA
jgi:cell division protein FtsB